MAEQSGFFADVDGDRTYTDTFLAQWVASFISNGVYNGELGVTAGDHMQITIPAGRAWINGYYYKNDNDLILPITNADGVLSRKDIVVLRWDVDARSITAQVIQGTSASNPVTPAIARTVEQYDLKLAEISIPAGTTEITQDLITDTRLNNSVCGIVTSVVDQVDTTTFYNQIAADLEHFRSVNEADFTAWVQGLKDVLDENTAGNLLNMINDLAGNGRTTETVKGNADDISSLQSDDIETRLEILDLKLKLDEKQVSTFLNKTDIGFYDLFNANDDNIDMPYSTAIIADTDATFAGDKLLKFKEEQFDNFNNVELAIYDKERQYINAEADVNNSNAMQVAVFPYSINAGDKFYINGQVYTVTDIQLAA